MQHCTLHFSSMWQVSELTICFGKDTMQDFSRIIRVDFNSQKPRNTSCNSLMHIALHMTSHFELAGLVEH